jgi:hypothetical protein
MLPMLDSQAHGTHGVELIDVESLYGPGLASPRQAPAGSKGYGHRTVRQGMWSAEADRFAGAVLLSEVLALSDPRACQLLGAQKESFFGDNELQVDGPVYQAVWTALNDWDSTMATLFYRAWISQILRECPTFGEWRLAISRLTAPPETVRAVPSPGSIHGDGAGAEETPRQRPPSPWPKIAAGVTVMLFLALGLAGGYYVFPSKNGDVTSAPAVSSTAEQPTAAEEPTAATAPTDVSTPLPGPTDPPTISTELPVPIRDELDGSDPGRMVLSFGADLPPARDVSIRLTELDSCDDTVTITVFPTGMGQQIGQRDSACKQSVSFNTGAGGPAEIVVGSVTEGTTPFERASDDFTIRRR